MKKRIVKVISQCVLRGDNPSEITEDVFNAMAEPTPKMCDVFPGSHETARDIWQAMLKVALE